jgi:hypothetical protein
VLLSAAISPAGPPRQILTAWTKLIADSRFSQTGAGAGADITARTGRGFASSLRLSRNRRVSIHL